jgi:hypothetical protein
MRHPAPASPGKAAADRRLQGTVGTPRRQRRVSRGSRARRYALTAENRCSDAFATRVQATIDDERYVLLAIADKPA